MTQSDETQQSDLSAFVQKYKIPLLIGGGVLFVMYGMEPTEQNDPQYSSGPYEDPYYESGPASGGSGGNDDSYEEWRRRQQEQDEGHERFVQETIREEQTCQDPDTGEVYDDVPIHIQCD